MSLIIALAMIIIIVCKVVSEKAEFAEIDRKNAERDIMFASWENIYVDNKLEETLRKCISEEENRQLVCEEVFHSIRDTKFFQDYINEDHFLKIGLDEDQRVALDIMLANRGKISSRAARFGYYIYTASGRAYVKKAAEYADTILSLINKKRPELKLYYYEHAGSCSYIWGGSRDYVNYNGRDGVTLRVFDKAEFLKTTEIPPIE